MPRSRPTSSATTSRKPPVSAISVDLFQRLNQLEHFNYIKDSAGDLSPPPGIPRHRITGC